MAKICAVGGSDSFRAIRNNGLLITSSEKERLMAKEYKPGKRFIEYEGHQFHERAHPDAYELAIAAAQETRIGKLLDIVPRQRDKSRRFYLGCCAFSSTMQDSRSKNARTRVV